MKAKFILPFLLLFTICFSQQYPTLFSHIQLQPTETVIDVEDYFPYVKDYQITYIENGLSYKKDKNLLTISGEMKPIVSYLQLTVQGKKYDIPMRKSARIPYVFTFVPDREYNNLKIKGNFNGWDLNANPMILKDGKYQFTVYINPGKYEYVFAENGKEFPDPTNPNRIGNGIGGINSTFIAGNINQEKPIVSIKEFKNKSITISLASNTEYDYSGNIVALYNNTKIPVKSSKENGIHTIEIPNTSQKNKRSFIRVFGYTNDKASNDLLIPLEFGKPITDAKKLTRQDKNTIIMYSLMVDRFFDADKTNNKPWNKSDVIHKADWHGGDLKGVIAKLNNNFFTDLGVNTIWLSPIIKNPEGTYAEMNEYGVKTKFTGYHGYWPISSSKIDYRFGTENDLKNLLSQAHHQNINIYLDYVANHVHQEHPMVKQHPDWFNPLLLPDGRKNIRLYDEQRLTTWFEDFMPDLNLEKAEVANAMSDSAVWWFKKYDIDGFRHDATKHIPNSFWRLLTKKLKTQVKNRNIYQIGESYGGADLIASYVNIGMLDAQFDFNLYHHISHGLMDKEYSLKNLKTALEESLYFYGYNHLMGNISGNHDKGRITSYADGSISFNESAKEAGYKRDINNNGKIGFERVAQLHAINMFIPGIPVIYYGDEIGFPGGDDPDNRRDMIFQNLNDNQLFLRNLVKKCTHFRRDRMELLYGTTEIVFANDNQIILKRTYANKESILVINKSDKAYSIDNKIFNTIKAYKRLITNSVQEDLILPNSFEIFYN